MTHMYFSAEGRISYGHLGHTNSCFIHEEALYRVYVPLPFYLPWKVNYQVSEVTASLLLYTNKITVSAVPLTATVTMCSGKRKQKADFFVADCTWLMDDNDCTVLKSGIGMSCRWCFVDRTIILVVVFSQFLRRLQVNVCVRTDGRWEERGFPCFGVFAVSVRYAATPATLPHCKTFPERDSVSLSVCLRFSLSLSLSLSLSVSVCVCVCVCVWCLAMFCLSASKFFSRGLIWDNRRRRTDK